MEYFGNHQNAFAILGQIRKNNFENSGTTVQSEYYHALGYIAIKQFSYTSSLVWTTNDDKV